MEDFNILELSLATNDKHTFNIYEQTMRDTLENYGMSSDSTKDNVDITMSKSYDRTFKDTVMFLLAHKFFAFLEFGAQIFSGNNKNGGLALNG